MTPLTTTYIEYRCPKCGEILWSKDPDEIRIWRELHEQGAFKCPICNTPMQFHRALGNNKEVEQE